MRNRLLAGAAASALLMAVGAASAQTNAPAVPQNGDGDAVVLDTINVAGDGRGQAAVATQQETVLTERTTRAELDARQITDIRDIDQIAPGVTFSETSRSFNIRGLDRNRVLTTVDGIRLPWIEDGARGLTGGVSGFNFNTLSEIDLVKGADSSVFGGGGIGGVIALRTLEPEDIIRPDRDWGALSKLTFDSRDTSFAVDQAAAFRAGNTSMLVQGGYRIGEEYENNSDLGGDGIGRGEKDPRDFDQGNLLVKLRQRVDGVHVFGLTGELFDRRDDIEARGESITTYRVGSADREEVNKRQRISAEYKYDGGGWLDAADAVVYWQRQQLEDEIRGERLTTPAGNYRRLTEREEITYGVSGNAMKTFEAGGLTHAFSIGGEVYGSKASSLSSGDDSCGPPPYPPFAFNCNFLHTNQADMPDVDGATVGIYAQNEITVAPTVRLTPGIRFDWYRQSPESTSAYEENPTFRGLPDDSSDHAFSPKLRAEWDVAPKATLFAQYAAGFRAPSANELYMSYGGPGTYLRLGDPDLEPETSNGFEIGAILGDEQFGGSVGGFYNRYKNFIDAVGVDPASVGIPPGLYPFGITQTLNRDSVEIFGAEAKVHYRHLSGWHGWATAGYYEGRDRDEDIHLNSIPAFKVVGSVGYATEEWGADVIVTGVASRDDAEAAFNETSGYGLVDLTAWYSPRQVKGLTLRAGVYNIFDKEYVDALNLPDGTTTRPREFFTEPGRSVKVSATYQF
jgi:hemoglobin/transferrin/lactoferrin receptor protein